MPCQCSCDCSKFNGYKWISRGSAEEHWAECPLRHCVGSACTRSEEDFYRFLEITQPSRAMSVCSEDCMALYDEDSPHPQGPAPTAATPTTPTTATPADDEEDRLRQQPSPMGTAEADDDAASYFRPNSIDSSDSEDSDDSDSDSDCDGESESESDCESEGEGDSEDEGDCDCDECTGACYPGPEDAGATATASCFFPSFADEVCSADW